MNNLINQTLPANADSQTQPKQVDYLLLDGSGSMYGRWHDSLHALDSYAVGLKTNEITSQVILATFSGGSGVDYQVARDTTPQAWNSLHESPPTISGGDTPLYDAINIMVRSLRDLNPDKASLVVVTDGEENGSRTTTLDQALGLLNWCRGRGWQVTFIGCDFNNSRLAKLLGGSDQTAIGAPVKRLTDIASELAKKRAYYDKFGTPMGFSDEEKKQFGGYLPDHTAK